MKRRYICSLNRELDLGPKVPHLVDLKRRVFPQSTWTLKGLCSVVPEFQGFPEFVAVTISCLAIEEGVEIKVQSSWITLNIGLVGTLRLTRNDYRRQSKKSSASRIDKDVRIREK